MLWKLELSCADAQAQARRSAPAAPRRWPLTHACVRAQALADMQANATERSLPPPSYSDKARDTAALRTRGARTADTCAAAGGAGCADVVPDA